RLPECRPLPFPGKTGTWSGSRMEAHLEYRPSTSPLMQPVAQRFAAHRRALGKFIATPGRQQRTVTPEIVFIHDCAGILTGSANRSRRGTEGESRPQPGVKIMTAECFPECSESGLAGAVARGDVCHLELVVQARDDLLDVGVRRDD